MTALRVGPTAAEDQATRARAISAVVDAAARMRADAERALASASEAVQRAEAALGAAEAAHATPPGDDGDGVLKAADALRLAHVRLAAAKARASEAVEAHAGAVSALDASKLEEHKARLREAAAPQTLAAAIAPHWDALLEAHAKLTEAAEAIGDRLAASHAASKALRDSGEYVVDLDPVHAFLPGLRALANRGAVVSGSFGPSFATVRQTPLTGHALVALLDSVRSRPELAHHVEPFKAKLALLAGVRTALEADAIESVQHKARQSGTGGAT